MSQNREMLFLKIAVKNNLLSSEQAEQVVASIEKRQELGVKRTPAEVAVEKEFMTEEQAESVQAALRASLPPERIAGFEVHEKIGGGAVGTVYKARQVSLDKIVALKLLHQSLSKHPKFVEQFIREAKAVGKLNHPHIVHAIDAGEVDGYDYLAMEYVDGETLKDRINSRGKLSEKEGLDLARAIAQGLANAHSHGLLHRDLKPDNILLGRDGQIKVADLGLAMPLDDAQVLAVEHKRMGTPYYLSPEQAQGERIDERSDLYALGATLYHAFAGKPLFTGKTVKEILTKQVHQTPVSLREVRGSLSEVTDALVMKLLAKDAADRFQSAAELLSAIDAAESATSTAQAGASRPAPRARRPGAAKPGATRPTGAARASASRPTPARPSRPTRDEPLEVESGRPTMVRRKAGQLTMFGGILGGVIGLIFLLMAVNRNTAEGSSPEEMEVAKQEELTELDEKIIAKRRKEWRAEIDDQDKLAKEVLADLLARVKSDKDRLRGLQNLLEKNTHSKTAPAIIAKLDEIRSHVRTNKASAGDNYFTKAEELRGKGSLWAAYRELEKIPPRLQNNEDISLKMDELLLAISDEIDARWETDKRQMLEFKKNKDYRQAIAILEKVPDYANPEIASSADNFRAEFEALMKKHEETERNKLLADEINRYRTVAGEYKVLALNRDFKECVSRALTLQAEITTASVRKMVEADLEAFELVNNFIEDGIQHMISLGDEGKDVTLKLKDKQRVKGKVRRSEGGRVWVEVTSGGGKAEVPVELEKIADESIFPQVEEKHGEKSPAYLVPLGVLFSYRGYYSIAQQHFDIATNNGFTPDSWLEKLEWLKANLGDG